MPERHDVPERRNGAGSTRAGLIGTALVALLGGAWFVWSHFVLATAAGDAVGEAIGVVFGLLMLGSIIGAVATSRRRSG
jgi:hypothetical protein